MKPKHWLMVVGALSLLYFAGLLYFAQSRGIDGDEGFYSTAARLAWEGKIPCRDFMFSQGVVIPYVYGWIWAVHPQSLVSMRFFSVALGSVTVSLWGLFLFSIKRLPAGVALATFLMILMNPYWISWHAVVKTFAFADFLISVVLMCLYFGLESGRVKWYVGAGVALGLCVSSRALYGPLVPFSLAWLALLDWKESGRRFRRSLACLAGCAGGMLPMAINFAADPRAFLFNNFQYRPLLDSYYTTGFSQTIRIHLAGITDIVHRRFFAAELLLALLGIISLLERRRKKDNPYTSRDYQYLQLALAMMLVYSVTALLPIPTYGQYLDGPVLPFLVLFIAEGLWVSFQVSWKWVVVLAVLAPLLCWRDLAPEAAGSSLSSYRKVAEVVRENSTPDSTVLSDWPGYVFESGRRCFPGAENEFVYAVGKKVSPAVRARFHLIAKDDVLRAISTGVPDIYIGPLWFLTFTMSEAERVALQRAVDARYSLVKAVDGVNIYRKSR